MKFLVDAQLPRRFCTWLTEAGHDAIHTLDLPHGNRTSDAEVIEIAEREKRVVVTKDDDFVQSYLVTGPDIPNACCLSPRGISPTTCSNNSCVLM